MKVFHTQEITELASEVLRLEQCGKYDEAFTELSDIWTDATSFPKVDDLQPIEAAEILLRCGSLIGFIGHHKQILHFQERSKNLLTEAHQRFINIYHIEKITECENYLALAYCRTGEFTEAETFIEEALSHNLDDIASVRLHSIVAKSFVFLSTGKHQENIELCHTQVKHFIRNGNPYLCGSIFTNFGVSLRNLGKSEEALEIYSKAKEFHKKSGHQVYLATIENNLANTYKDRKLFNKAHQASDISTEIFRKINERTREGYSLDTKAQIFLAERNYEMALEVINKAIKILKNGENAAYLVDSMLTKILIQIASGDIFSATKELIKAHSISATKISESAADNLIKEYEKAIEKGRLPKFLKIHVEKESESEESLEIILPPEIACFNDYQGVWIKNSHLEKFGLTRGDFALVTKDKEITRGDLVAINVFEDNSVICGIYDSEFGVIYLEMPGCEPELFNQDAIEIIGRIIGCGKKEDNLSNKILIKPLI